MKKIASAFLSIFLAAALCAAQSTSSTASVSQPAAGPANIAGLLYASNFAHWTISPTPQGNRWDSPIQCFSNSGGLVFPSFSTTAPVTIVDLANSSNTETVTPTLVSYAGSGCSVALPATHAHSNYYLQSGTLGLQEALNFAGAGHFVVILTPDWQTMGGTTGMITSATAGSNTTILDCRTSTCMAYTGTSPSANVTGTGKQVLQTSPTLITPVLGVATATSINGALVQSAAGVPSANCAIGAIGENLSASSTSTVLYVCYPANTWTAITVP